MGRKKATVTGKEEEDPPQVDFLANYLFIKERRGGAGVRHLTFHVPVAAIKENYYLYLSIAIPSSLFEHSPSLLFKESGVIYTPPHTDEYLKRIPLSTER